MTSYLRFSIFELVAQSGEGIPMLSHYVKYSG